MIVRLEAGLPRLPRFCHMVDKLSKICYDTFAGAWNVLVMPCHGSRPAQVSNVAELLSTHQELE
jgi:hypothetical protein